MTVVSVLLGAAVEVGVGSNPTIAIYKALHKKNGLKQTIVIQISLEPLNIAYMLFDSIVHVSLVSTMSKIGM